jgi:hypothetical protein
VRGAGQWPLFAGAPIVKSVEEARDLGGRVLRSPRLRGKSEVSRRRAWERSPGLGRIEESSLLAPGKAEMKGDDIPRSGSFLTSRAYRRH